MSDTSLEAGTTITVAGLGHAPIQPDRAEIGLGANASAETAAEARTAVAAAMTAILAAVRGLGVRTLRTSSLSVAPRYDHRGETMRIVGYEATNAVTATIEDLETLGAVVDAAIAAGATSLDGPRFFAADPSGAIATARRLAVEDAAGRATTLAEAAGLRVIGIASISEGGERPIPIPRAARVMALADAVPSPVEVGADEVRVEVEVVYRAG
jgi:uncharacterized protein